MRRVIIGALLTVSAGVGPDGAHAPHLAAVSALGRRERARDGRDLGPARRDHREPLVAQTARARHRCAHRLERDRPAGSLRPRAAVLHFGWRYAAATVAIVALGFVLPLVAFLMRDRPADLGLNPYGADVADPIPATGNAFKAAIAGLQTARRTRAFWLLAGSFFICGASTNGLIGTHLIPAAMDHGLGEVPAASLLALIGVFDIIGTTCSGWLTDRYDPRVLLFWYYALRGLSLLALPYVFGSPHFGLILFCRSDAFSHLGRDRPADSRVDRGDLRARERRHRLRLDFRRPSVRRRVRSLGWRRSCCSVTTPGLRSAGLPRLFASGLVTRVARGEGTPAPIPAPASA